MKLKEKVKVWLDTQRYKEVDGINYTFMVNKRQKLEVILHQSEHPCTPDYLDISEKESGLRLTTTGKSVSSSKTQDVDNALRNFLDNEHSLKEIIEKRNLFLKEMEM